MKKKVWTGILLLCVSCSCFPMVRKSSMEEIHQTLFKAIEENNYDDFCLILQSQAFDLEIRNKYGDTPLTLCVTRACYNKYPVFENRCSRCFDMVKYLTTHHKVDLNAKGSLGYAPLQRSLYENDLEMVEYLLKKKTLILKIIPLVTLRYYMLLKIAN